MSLLTTEEEAAKRCEHYRKGQKVCCALRQETCCCLRCHYDDWRDCIGKDECAVYQK